MQPSSPDSRPSISTIMQNMNFDTRNIVLTDKWQMSNVPLEYFIRKTSGPISQGQEFQTYDYPYEKTIVATLHAIKRLRGHPTLAYDNPDGATIELMLPGDILHLQRRWMILNIYDAESTSTIIHGTILLTNPLGHLFKAKPCTWTLREIMKATQVLLQYIEESD
jgi:hypothetical protein